MKPVSEIYQPLFDLLANEHGITPTISEMDEIILKAQEVVKEFNNEVKPRWSEFFKTPKPYSGLL